MSLAHSRGPHDGSGLLEQTIDTLLSQPGRAAVLAAGNDYARDRHASGPVLPGVPRSLRWEFAPLSGDPPSWNVLDAFLDESAGPAIVEIEQPGGEAVIVPASGSVDLAVNGNKVGEATAQSLGAGRREIEIRIDHRGVPETWTIRLTAGAAPVPFHAWIDCLYSEQSAFALGDSDHSSTLSTICTGRRAIAVGAYDALSPTLRAASFTAAGPSLNPDPDLRRKPDVSAPGIDVRAARSRGGKLKVAGRPWRTPASVVKSGTSMAAPHVAGTVALMLQKKPAATSDAIRAALVGTARKDPPARPPTAPPGETWDPVYGFGRIDAAKAIDAL
jgi:subtilisin family serine protease